jgi:L-threonylcarbamoyladenylate synthase
VSYVTNSFDEKVVELLQGGAVGFMPSDTIYGLSCRALDEAAVERVHKIKNRDSGKPCIVLVANLKMLDLLSISADQARLVQEYWPGKISLEFNAPNAPSWLHRGTNKFAIRMPDNSKLRKLIKKVGPIVSTSANTQGGQPAESIDQAKEYFGEDLDFYIDQGTISSEPSTIVVLKNGKLEVDRQGAVKIKETK